VLDRTALLLLPIHPDQFEERKLMEKASGNLLAYGAVPGWLVNRSQLAPVGRVGHTQESPARGQPVGHVSQDFSRKMWLHPRLAMDSYPKSFR
jgi:hypothetical protein